MPTPVTDPGVGHRCPTTLEPPGDTSASLHVEANKVTVVIADNWSNDELTNNDPIPFGISQRGRLLMLSAMLSDDLCVSVPWSHTGGTPNEWTRPVLSDHHPHLVVHFRYVDSATGLIARIRTVTLGIEASYATVGYIANCGPADVDPAEVRKQAKRAVRRFDAADA